MERTILNGSEYSEYRPGSDSVHLPINGNGKGRKIIRLSSCTLHDLPCIPLSTVLESLDDDEYGDGQLFAKVFNGICAYDFLEKVWYMWEGHYWVRDDGQGVYHLVSGFLSSVYIKASAEVNVQIRAASKSSSTEETDVSSDDESKESTRQKKLKAQKAALLKRADSLKKISRVRNVLEFAMSDKTLHVPHVRTGKEVTIAWDRNPWLLGTYEGVIDLRTGELTDGNPKDFIRMITPVKWKGLNEPCPRFNRFLQEIFSDRNEQERADIINFLHRVLGYGITGLFQHHIFLTLIGDEGRNGKDTLIKCLLAVLGKSLAGPVSKELFISTKFGASPGAASPHKMSLQGKRLAWCSETDKGESFNVAQIKDITGTETQRGRNLRENEQSFDATHLLILLTNNPPHADATDKAFWERICPIMFNVRYVDNPDPNKPFEYKPDITLGATLEKEASGILAWLVRGCLIWQKEGLAIPQCVLKERANYRDDEDTLGRFIKDCCVLRPDCKARGGSLYSAYQAWAEDNGLRKPITNISFARDMEKRFRKTTPGHVATYHGIGLRTNEEYALYVAEDDNRPEEEETPAPSSQQPGPVSTPSEQHPPARSGEQLPARTEQEQAYALLDEMDSNGCTLRLCDDGSWGIGVPDEWTGEQYEALCKRIQRLDTSLSTIITSRARYGLASNIPDSEEQATF